MPDSDVFRWKEPPKVPTGAKKETRWGVVAAQLRQNPTTWAQIVENSPVARGGNIARAKALQPRSDFEVVDRKNPLGGHDTYARYIG